MDRGSYIAGPSKFNTRIERTWRDMRRVCFNFYKKLFHDFETQGMQIDNQFHIYCLHYMFKRRMQEDLNQYRESWNNHKIRTANHYSPNQMLNMTAGYEDPPIFLDDEELYGVEQEYLDNDNDNENEDGANYIYVSPVLCPLTINQDLHFVNLVEPFTLNDSVDSLSWRFHAALIILINTSNINI